MSPAGERDSLFVRLVRMRGEDGARPCTQISRRGKKATSGQGNALSPAAFVRLRERMRRCRGRLRSGRAPVPAWQSIKRASKRVEFRSGGGGGGVAISRIEIQHTVDSGSLTVFHRFAVTLLMRRGETRRRDAAGAQ